jgi:hypothetical protein
LDYLVYDFNAIFPPDNSFDASQDEDLFFIAMRCDPLTIGEICWLIADRRTGEHRFYKTLITFNSKYKIRFFYNKQPNLLTGRNNNTIATVYLS